ncbi:hypothetical protein MTBPR1_40209 [Candidatus Terasakiella magnetica]|uniref:Uncharacterized protein n=1 Tax=Candidatus Terasakiella magnetica TaxID=1867952 RepID=A0A1C3RIU2_9PROT|nr:hypothetical protein MTBPR1_40209 [Candidatus Terasakiella magnetica]
MLVFAVKAIVGQRRILCSHVEREGCGVSFFTTHKKIPASERGY